MGQITREQLLERIGEVDKQLLEETKRRRRLIGEWEDMRARGADGATRKRIELIECMKKLNDLRGRRQALKDRLED